MTNTPTPTGDKVIGTITYTGGLGPVDTLHEIGIRLSPDSGMLLESDFHLVDSNGGSYTLDAPGSGTYYVSYGHDAGGLVFPEYGMVGSAYGSYNNLCLPPGSPIAVSGTTVLNLVFDDTCRFFGIYGNANYTGAMGVVEACTNLSLTFYLDSGYTVLLGSVSLPWNNKRYDWADAFGVIGTTYYVRAFFDQNGDAVGPCGAIPCVGTGDPYKDLGPFVTGFSTVANATFDDSLIWP